MSNNGMCASALGRIWGAYIALSGGSLYDLCSSTGLTDLDWEMVKKEDPDLIASMSRQEIEEIQDYLSDQRKRRRG